MTKKEYVNQLVKKLNHPQVQTPEQMIDLLKKMKLEIISCNCSYTNCNGWLLHE